MVRFAPNLAIAPPSTPCQDLKPGNQFNVASSEWPRCRSQTYGVASEWSTLSRIIPIQDPHLPRLPCRQTHPYVQGIRSGDSRCRFY